MNTTEVKFRPNDEVGTPKGLGIVIVAYAETALVSFSDGERELFPLADLRPAVDGVNVDQRLR